MGTKFTDLSAAGAITRAEIAALVQSGSSVQSPISDLLTFSKTVTTAASTYTIADEGIGVLEVNVGTCTVTLPDLATWAGRKIVIRKISSTAGTVTIQRAGSNTITRADLTSVSLSDEDDFFEFFAGSSRWVLTNGIYRGSDSNISSIAYYDGRLVSEVQDDISVLENTTYTNGTLLTFPIQYSAVGVETTDLLEGVYGNVKGISTVVSLSTTTIRLRALNTTAVNTAGTAKARAIVSGRWYA